MMVGEEPGAVPEATGAPRVAATVVVPAAREA